MRMGSSAILGLTLGDRGITCAQVVADGADRVVKKVGRFASPQSLLDKPEEAGRALRQFLDAHGFDAGRAVVGVPARWIIAQEKELPPTDTAQALSILRLQSERMSMGESDSLVVDYAGELAAASHRVLLVGILRTQVERIQNLLEAADLTLTAICPSALATSAMVGGDHSMLHLAPEGAELVQWRDGSPRLLRPIGVASDPAAAGAEMRRTLTMRPGATGELLLCDGIGLDTSTRVALLTRIGGDAHVMSPDPSLHVRVDPGAMNGAALGLAGNAHLPAIALGVVALGRKRLPVNFLQSKLAEKKNQRFSRQSILAAAAGVAIVLGLVLLYFTAQSREQEAAEIAVQIEKLKPDTRNAKAEIDRIAYGRTFFNARPPYLDCMRELTLALNYDESIWVSSMTLRDARIVQLQGRSTDRRLIVAFSERLKQNKNFSGVTLTDMRDAGAKSSEITFSINCIYQPVPPKPAEKK